MAVTPCSKARWYHRIGSRKASGHSACQRAAAPCTLRHAASVACWTSVVTRAPSSTALSDARVRSWAMRWLSSAHVPSVSTPSAANSFCCRCGSAISTSCLLLLDGGAVDVDEDDGGCGGVVAADPDCGS